ncbi:MAG: sigma-70 family RNA polymerase sigma factor [Bacteroidota bacterium]
MSEEEIKDVCRETVYEELFRQLAPGLRNFLVYKFRNLERANDIVQEAFLVLWKNCLQVTHALAKPYLYRVAQNQFIKLIEKDGVRQKHLSLQTGESDEGENPHFDLEYQELSEKLKDALEQLPDGQREVFILNRIEKKTYKEIAELQEVSVKAIEKKMHKALIKLRKVIKGI